MTNRFFFSIGALMMVVLFPGTILSQKMNAEGVIAKHLDSIAAEEKRSATKSLVVVGEVKIDYITQKNQPAKGRVVIASEGSKMFFGLSLNASDYSQEKIVFDGSKHSVAYVQAGVRSDLGTFVQSNDELITHGLLGGTLSTSWPLLNMANLKAKVSFGGTKKIDGTESYALKYAPKGGNDLDITMFFDKETFRHLRTEYTRLLSSSVGANIDQSARTSETRLKVVEDFSDHKEYQGRMIPTTYKMSYTFQGTNGTKEVSWTYDFSEFAINQVLDPGTFAVGK